MPRRPAAASTAVGNTLGDSSVTLRSMAWVNQRDAEFLIRMQPEGESRTPPRAAAPATPTPRPSPAVQADVSVDRTVDEQIEVERRTSDEDDLLDDKPSGS
jgi:hypothetical protein